MARTPQSAIAWAGVLVFLPFIGIPLFLIFGESRFAGYTQAGKGGVKALDEALHRIVRHLDGYKVFFQGGFAEPERMARNLTSLPATSNNDVRLLVDGNATFEAIFEASVSSFIDVIKSRIPSITTKPKLGVFSIACSTIRSLSDGLIFLKA